MFRGRKTYDVNFIDTYGRLRPNENLSYWGGDSNLGPHANVVGSLSADSDKHMPVLDIDLPCHLEDSTTPGTPPPVHRQAADVGRVREGVGRAR